MARLSGAAVLLIVVVPLLMYTCACLFVGVQLGGALERNPDGANIRQCFAKELRDIKRRGRNFVIHAARVLKELVPARRRVARSFTHDGRGGGHRGSNTQTQANNKHIYSGGHLEYKLPNYNNTYSRNHTSLGGGVISVGPWGGSGGRPFYMCGRSAPQLHSIVVFHSSVIHSLATMYSMPDSDGRTYTYTAGPWFGLARSTGGGAATATGRSSIVRAQIDLSAGEHVTAVEGTFGRFGSGVPDVVVTSLTFRTSNGTTYGPYGGAGDDDKATATRFSIPAATGCIVGFWGRSGWLLDAIGVYMKPSCSLDKPPFVRI